MSGHCHGDANDHDHDSGSDLGPRDNLYSQVDLDNVVALNSAASGPDNGRGSVVIKQWDQRLDETKVGVATPLR